MKCRQCGYDIAPVKWWHKSHHSQNRGFCCLGCEEVYDTIHAIEYAAMRKEELRNAVNN